MLTTSDKGSRRMKTVLFRLIVGCLGVVGLVGGAAAQSPGDVAKLLRVEWEPSHESWGRPRLVGYVYNSSRYRIGSIRLRLESLDASKQVTRETLAWTYVDVPSGGRAYFSVVRPPGAEDFRVTVESFVLIAVERREETP
jgi:hypothetical protein